MNALVEHLMQVYGFSQDDAMKVAESLGAAPMNSAPDSPTKEWLRTHGIPVTRESYVGPTLPPVVDKALHTGINTGLARTANAKYASTPEPSPESEWHKWAVQHPVRGMAKNELVQAGRFLKERLVGSTPDPEKLSAQKMLKDYLMAQDAQRAHDQIKDNLSQELLNAQAQDMFYVNSGGKVPASLGDFVQAGAMRGALPDPQVK